MSVQFAPTHGLKQNLTPAVNMAVGSSVDPAGATAARSAEVHPKQPRISDDHCYGLPYQDHNYGARPPPTPPESPMPGIAEPSQASVFNDVSLDSCDRFSEAPTVTIKCASAPRKHELLASSLTQDIGPSEALAENVNGDAGDLTRCICGFQHDDGYMICCDKCIVWQHIDCMQIDRNSIPETYLCEKCNPRLLDHVRAARLQKKKHEEFISCTDFDSVLSGSGDDSPCENVLYTAIHSTPTSITLSTNRKRNHQPSIGKKRKRSADNIKIIKNNDAAKRQRSKSFLSDEMEDEYGPIKCLWRMKMKQWSKSYQEAEDQNRYTESVRNAIHSSSARASDAEKATNSSDILMQLKAQLAKVQQLRSTLLAMEDIHIGQPIIEYQGCFSLTRQFEVPMAKIYEKPYPYILFYSGFDGLDICIDARTYGNKARYIRRSCSPNAEVRHILDEGLLRLFVYSSKLIKKETEITLPFDIKYENCSYMLPCACATKDCPVHRSNHKKAHINSEVRNNNNHGHKRLAPLRLSLGNLPCSQTNGYVSSEDSTTCDTEENAADNQRKKSREERKMEAYIRAFEKLEKKEKKKEQMQLHANDRGLTEDGKTPFTSCNTSTSAVTVTSLTATMASQEATSNAKTENPSQDATVPSTSVQAVIPQKRVARRRSGRVRRGSRKYHGEFYQTSATLGRKDSEMQPEIFLPVSEDSCDSANQELAKLLPSCDQPEFTSFTSTPSASVPSVPALSKVQNTSSTRPSIPTFTPHPMNNCLGTSTTTTPISSVIPTTVILETNKADPFQSAFCPTISMENCSTSMYDFQACNTQPETMIQENLTSHVTMSSPKLLSPSSSGRSRSSSGNSKYDESVSRSCSPLFPKTPLCTKPIYPSVSCDVVHWDFKPGLPSGIVPINVRTALRNSRYNPAKPIKKWWLQRAVNDSLLAATTAGQLKSTKTVDVSCESPVSVHSEKDSGSETVPWKKRLLSETAAPGPDEPDVENTDIVPVEKNVEEAVREEDGSEQAAPSDDEQDGEVEEVAESSDPSETATEMKDEESKVQEVSTTLTTTFPNDQVTPTDVIAPGLTAEDSNSNSSLLMQSQQTGGEDSSFLLDETSCESVIWQMDTVSDLRQTHYTYPAPVKRKVSLQEYLKRSKETKKPSTTATSTALTPVSSSVVPNTSAEPEPTSRTPEAPTCAAAAHVVESKTEPVKPSKSEVAANIVEINRSGKLEPDVLNKVLTHFKDEKEMTGLVNEVVRHLKATQRAKGPKEELEPEVEKKQEIPSSPVEDKTSATSSPSPRPVPLQKSLSESKASVNHLSLKKCDSGHSPSPKLFSSKQNQSTPSPRNDVAREKDRKSLAKVSPNGARSEQPPVETRKTPSVRSPAVLSREDSWSGGTPTQSRSRHGSGTSSSSSRSPRHHVDHGSGVRYPKQVPHHQQLSRTSSDNIRSGERPVSPTIPQKVPCITPAVPGQPIPSLVRSSDGRGPQPVYNRPSPTCDYRAPSPPPSRWQHSPPYMSRNGCAEVGRVPDKYSEPLSPPYSNRYYDPEHRTAGRDYYRYEDHPPPLRGNYHSNKHQTHYNGPPMSRRYSNEGYPTRRTPSPQMCHYRHSNTSTPPYYNDNRTPYPNDHRDRPGSTYRYHKPHPGGGYSRSPSNSPNPQHRRYASPVPYQPGPNYRNHYQGGYHWQD